MIAFTFIALRFMYTFFCSLVFVCIFFSFILFCFTRKLMLIHCDRFLCNVQMQVCMFMGAENWNKKYAVMIMALQRNVSLFAFFVWYFSELCGCCSWGLFCIFFSLVAFCLCKHVCNKSNVKFGVCCSKWMQALLHQLLNPLILWISFSYVFSFTSRLFCDNDTVMFCFFFFFVLRRVSWKKVLGLADSS